MVQTFKWRDKSNYWL